MPSIYVAYDKDLRFPGWSSRLLIWPEKYDFWVQKKSRLTERDPSCFATEYRTENIHMNNLEKRLPRLMMVPMGSYNPKFLSLSTISIWAQIIMCWRRGGFLCIIGCLAASLTSTHQMPITLLPCHPATKIIPRYGQMPWGAKPHTHPFWEPLI